MAPWCARFPGSVKPQAPFPIPVVAPGAVGSRCPCGQVRTERCFCRHEPHKHLSLEGHREYRAPGSQVDGWSGKQNSVRQTDSRTSGRTTFLICIQISTPRAGRTVKIWLNTTHGLLLVLSRMMGNHSGVEQNSKRFRFACANPNDAPWSPAGHLNRTRNSSVN